MADQAVEVQEPAESERVRLRRFREGRAAGLSLCESHLFADSDADVGVLRHLVAAGCDPTLIARIII